MTEKGPVTISLADVLRTKLGKRAQRVPAVVVRALEKLICQDEMNDILRKAWPREGADFCDAVLGELDIRVDIAGRENLPDDPRAIFVCNHPLGGLDGIAVISVLSHIYGPGLRVLVNDMLMAIGPLKGSFIPVNKHGAQSRGAAAGLDATLAGTAPVVIFPAGLCSRRGRNGRVADLPWHKMFVSKAISSGRPVVPMFFSGRNSAFFYRFASLRKRLGIKLNIEMVRLPAEVFRARGSRFTLVCGRPIEPEELAGLPAAQEAARIRDIVYTLAPKTDNTEE